jgi:hypothetical protein
MLKFCRWFRVALVFPLALGCGHGARAPRTPVPQEISALPARYDACIGSPESCKGNIELMSLRDMRQHSQAEALLTGPLAGAPASGKPPNPLRRAERALARAFDKPTPPPSAPTPTLTAGPREQRPMIDLEAHLSLEVEDTRTAARAVRSLTTSAGGEVVNEAFEDGPSASGSALSLRVPSEKAQWLIGRISELGKLRALKTQANEVSRRVSDAQTVLDNQRAALARYQELLARAQNAHEMTEIEKELERVRLAIERVTTDLAWLNDRVERSTVYVQLALPRDERSEKTAQLYPGLRLPYVLDLEPGGGSSGYLGGGISALVARPFNFDLDLLTHTESSQRDGVDLLLVSVGVELYSDLLGGGKRRSFNPYLGFRAGYANLASDGALLLGGSVGLELLKTSLMICELQLRAYALVGGEHGTHALLQPALALNFAY